MADKKQYDPIRLPFLHPDSNEMESIGLYGAQGKFLWTFALAMMTKCPTGACFLISTALLCDALKWAARDLCLAIQGRSAARRKNAEAKGTNPLDMIEGLPDAKETPVPERDTDDLIDPVTGEVVAHAADSSAAA